MSPPPPSKRHRRMNRAAAALLSLLIGPGLAHGDELARIGSAEVESLSLLGLSLDSVEERSWNPTAGVDSRLNLGPTDVFTLTLQPSGPDGSELTATVAIEGEAGSPSAEPRVLVSAVGAMQEADGRFALAPELAWDALLRPEQGARATVLLIEVVDKTTFAASGAQDLDVRLTGQAAQLTVMLDRIRDWWLASWSALRFTDGLYRDFMPPGLDCESEGVWSVTSAQGCVGLRWHARPDRMPVGVVDIGGEKRPVYASGSGYQVSSDAARALGAARRPLVLQLFPLTHNQFLVELDLGQIPPGNLAALAEQPGDDDDDTDGPDEGGGGLPLGWLALLVVALVAGAAGAEMRKKIRKRGTSAGYVAESVQLGKKAQATTSQGDAERVAPPEHDAEPHTIAPSVDPALTDRLSRLEERLSGLGGRLDEADTARREFVDRSGDWQEGLGGLTERIGRVGERIDSLDGHAEGANRAVQNLGTDLGGLKARVEALEGLAGRVEQLEEGWTQLRQWRQRTELAAAAGDEVGLAAADDPVWRETVAALDAQKGGRGELGRLAVEVAELDPVLRLLVWYADVLAGKAELADSNLSPWFDKHDRPEAALLASARDHLEALRRGQVAAFARIHAWLSGKAPERSLARQEKVALRGIAGLLDDGAALAREVVQRVAVPFLTEACYLVDAVLVERWGLLETDSGQGVRQVAMETLRHGADSADWYEGSTSGDDFHLEAVQRLLVKRLGWSWVEVRPYLVDEDQARALAAEAGVTTRIQRLSLSSVADRAGAKTARLVGPHHVFRIVHPGLVGPSEALPLECHVLGE